MEGERANVMNQEQWDVRAGQPTDYPGCWMLSGSKADGKSGAYFRKEDGTYWEVVEEDWFPSSGRTLQVKLGKSVTADKILTTLREYYLEWQQTKFRVEVFDCPKRGFRNFADRESANQYRDSLVS